MSHPYLAYFEQDEFPTNPNLTFDFIQPHISEVTSFWAAGKQDELVEYIKTLFDQSIYDIRLLTFYFYSLWAKDDSDCPLDQVLMAFQKLLKQQPTIWLITEEDPQSDTSDESNKQELQRCLNLFFNRVEQRLSRFAEQINFDINSPCAIIKSSNQFAELVGDELQLPEMLSQIKQINSYFEDACTQEKARMEEEEEEAIEENTVVKDTPEDTTPNKVATSQIPQVTPIPPQQQNLPQQTSPTQYSAPLQQLLNKLQIFEALIQERSAYKASIVFESIQKELQEFNPLHYLPELFSGYAKTHALYATELNQLVQQYEGKQSQALKDYFAIDPNGFLQLKIDQQPQEQVNDLERNDSDDYRYDT